MIMRDERRRHMRVEEVGGGFVWKSRRIGFENIRWFLSKEE